MQMKLSKSTRNAFIARSHLFLAPAPPFLGWPFCERKCFEKVVLCVQFFVRVARCHGAVTKAVLAQNPPRKGKTSQIQREIQQVARQIETSQGQRKIANHTAAHKQTDASWAVSTKAKSADCWRKLLSCTCNQTIRISSTKKRWTQSRKLRDVLRDAQLALAGEDEGCFYAWQQIRTPRSKKDEHAVRASIEQELADFCVDKGALEDAL